MCDGCTAILTGGAITTCFLPRTLTVAQLAKSSARVVSIVGKDRVNIGLLLVSETHVLVSHDRGVAQTRNHRAVLPRLNPVIEERYPVPCQGLRLGIVQELVHLYFPENSCLERMYEAISYAVVIVALPP